MRPRLKLYAVYHNGRHLIQLNHQEMTGATIRSRHLVVATSKRHALTLAQEALGSTMIEHPDGVERGHPIPMSEVCFVGYCDQEGSKRPELVRDDGIKRPRA